MELNFVSHIDGKKIELTPESAIQIQERLNSDISMVLDECTEYPASFSRAKSQWNYQSDGRIGVKILSHLEKVLVYLELFKEVCLKL